MRRGPSNYLVANAMRIGVCVLVVTANFKVTFGDHDFCVGAAAVDITPKAGVSMDGPISKPGPVRGVHDSLMSRAIVLQLGEKKLLLCVNDMCMIDREVYDKAKKLVLERTGIEIDSQLMAATHSHATPRLNRISTRPPDEAYRDFVAEMIADAAENAWKSRRAARVGFGRFDKPGLANCRRSLCEAGSVAPDPFGQSGERVRSVAGKGKVLQPAGPVDPEFTFLSFQGLDGQPIAILGNFSVHYCGGYASGQVSADYFGVYSRRLETIFGRTSNAFLGMMSNATSGDIGSFARRTEIQGRRPPWTRMQYFGTMLADETAAANQKLDFSVPAKLESLTSELELSIRKPSVERIQWARNLIDDSSATAPHRWSRVYAEEAIHLSEHPDREKILLQAFRIGDVVITAAPCEMFSETGIRLKKDSHVSKMIVMELANGYSGYLPTAQQHEWGGYETWPARSSRLEVAAEKKIRLELLRLARELSSGQH